MTSSDIQNNVHPNHALIVRFYEAFQKKDFRTMQACYDEDAVFSDAVFKSLNATQVRMMWEMLLLRGKDLELTFGDVYGNEIKGSAWWTASYTFTTTGRKVVNKINASFIFHEGKIIQHTDNFDFYAWAKQAFGWKGFILGKTKFFQQKVREGAMQSLNKYMEKVEAK